MLTMTVAGLAGLECVAGRLAAMHRGEHRTSYQLGYLMAFIVCILAVSMIWQQLDVRWLDLAAWGIAAYLSLTWDDWRHGPPAAAERGGDWPRDAVPSRVEDGDRQS